MEIYVIDERDAARKGIKSSHNLSEIRGIDPLYIFDMRDYPGNWLDDIRNLGLDGKDISLTRLENDWLPDFIKVKDMDGLLVKMKDEERAVVLACYEKDETNRYYRVRTPGQHTGGDLLHKFGKKKPYEGKKPLSEILKRINFDFYGTFFKELSMDAGMYYYCRPIDNQNLKDHLDRIKTHYREMKKYDFIKYSPFYARMLNRMDYEVSLVNRERLILYANWQRRRLHGDDILGRYCYEVFPVDSLGTKCQSCPMDRVIDGKPEYADKYRCEVHKLRKLRAPHDVYFVSEASSLFEIKEPGSTHIERLGINVVRDNTIRIISQEFQKVMQRVHGLRHIVYLLKFALIGGNVDDFRKEFEVFFKKEKISFNVIVEKISYLDIVTQENKIMNFGFGRFRYYRNVFDIFNKNYGEALKTGRHIMQIYDAYDMNGQMQEFIGRSIDYNDEAEDLINKLEFDPSGQLLNNKGDLLAEITENAGSKNFAEGIGLLHNMEDSAGLREWYDIELVKGDELIGYVSVDWLGTQEPKKSMRYEILLGVKDFMGFVNQSIQRVSDHRQLQLTGDLKNIIYGDYPNEDDMYFAFSERLCQSFQALKCEIYLFTGKNSIERKYLYYRGLNQEKAEAINERLPRHHQLGQHLTGNILGIILDYYAAHPEGGDEIYKRCINVLNYDSYDAFYSQMPEKKVKKEYKEQEEVLLSQPGYFGKPIKLINCLIAPIIYKNEPVGAVKITNNLTDGRLFFPINEQKILYDVAGQLAIKIHNFKLHNRGKKISQVFNQLADILRRSYAEIKDEQITDEIRRKIILDLRDIVGADETLYYLVEKDEDFQACLVRIVPEPGDKDTVAPEKIVKSTAAGFKYGKLFFDLVDKLDPDNAGMMRDFFEKSVGKIILRRIDHNKKPYSILFLQIGDKKFDEADLEVIDTVTSQIEALLTIRALRMQSMEIMDNIAHQIISPLKGLETHCNNLLDNMLPEDEENYFYYESDDKKRYVINLLKSQTSYVRFIAENYRQFMNFVAGKKPDLELTRIDLASVVMRIASIYQPIARSQGLGTVDVLHSGKPFPMMGDELMLIHIFVCLIDNAIKYADKGRPINIDLSEDRDYHYVRVIDWGIPIDKEQWEKIFEREYRIPEARKRFKQGSGLGLYIVHQICGAIKAECVVEKSDMMTRETVFRVKLPRSIPKTKK